LERRDFLQKTGAASLAAAALAVKGYGIPWAALVQKAEADSDIPLTSLKSALDPNECLLLLPSDARYAQYQNAFNLRTALKPQARVLVRSTRGVQQLVQWLKANNVPFAIRGGGHSYEGFSQSSSVVIDTRLMNKVELDSTGQTVSVGGGAALGEVYAEVGKRNLAIPAGSCLPVGVSGHTLGGGFGQLARPFGLTCDSLVTVELVDAKGSVLNCSESENQDLFWALRGGGGGSFGVATRYQYRTHAVNQLAVFGFTWVLPPKRAASIFKAWQQWITHAPEQITCFMRVTVDSSGAVTLHGGGQTTGAESAFRAELKKISLEPVQKVKTGVKDFLGAVRHFAGTPGYEQVFMKGKSDYLYEPMSDEGMLALFLGMQKHRGIAAIYDGYGGAVAKTAPDATAFFHRKALCSVQYVTQAGNSAGIATGMQSMKEFHDSLRPYYSGRAYINYPDLEIKNYGEAYWGDNFERLKKVKAAVDPENFFRHAQSIPVR
jgi:FAD/FMN-containing dehydrogenase